MKSSKMYNLMTMLSTLASNVAMSERKGLSYDLEEVEEDLDSLMDKIYDEIKERKDKVAE